MNSAHEVEPRNKLERFGIEIYHSRSEAAEIPPEQTASETIGVLEQEGELEIASAIKAAADEIGQVVQITRTVDGHQPRGLLEIFTVEQLLDMRSRIRNYLGTDIDSHLAELAMPPGYPFYIGRLAAYFSLSDKHVTSQFGAFEDRHTKPSTRATGPMERNSREYANLANEAILQQFESFYQSEFSVILTGPIKKVAGGRVSWERGIAECQFLVLDYVRDLLAAKNANAKSQPAETISMTVDDIRSNVTNLLVNRRRLVSEVAAINPMLAEQINHALSAIAEFTVEVFHRGRIGVPRFQKEPDSARRAILRVEELLVHAADLDQARADQAEIPILDV